MNKYTVIIAIAVGISNILANEQNNEAVSSKNRIEKASDFVNQQIKNTGNAVGGFCNEVIANNPIKLAVAGGIKVYRAFEPTVDFELTLNRIDDYFGKDSLYRCRPYGSLKSSRLPAMIVTYSVGKTLYNRLKQ